MTYFNTQIDNEKNTYSIQFETDDKQLFKIVEEVASISSFIVNSLSLNTSSLFDL